MPQKFLGGCRCGAIRYALSLNDLPLTYTCHCRDCQTWSGSAFSQQAVVPNETLEVEGQTALFELVSGPRTSRQHACPACFTRVFNTNSSRPDAAIIRAGTLDMSDMLKVAAHIWVKRKQAWIVVPADVPSWDEGAPDDQFWKALRGPNRT